MGILKLLIHLSRNSLLLFRGPQLLPGLSHIFTGVEFFKVLSNQLKRLCCLLLLFG